MRQRAKWQPAPLQADVERSGGSDRRKLPHAAAEHGLQGCSYNEARDCRPKKTCNDKIRRNKNKICACKFYLQCKCGSAKEMIIFAPAESGTGHLSF